MDRDDLRRVLAGVRDGSLDLESAAARLERLPYDDLGFARIDNHRVLRRGRGEAIFCAGKSASQVTAIAERMVDYGHQNVLATRATPEILEALRTCVPVSIHEDVGLAIVNPTDVPLVGNVCVCTAGTSDIAVAEEAALTAECSGSRVDRLYDVGVAGIHRLLDQQETLAHANAIVAVAGMDGALASGICGLRPPTASPTTRTRPMRRIARLVPAGSEMNEWRARGTSTKSTRWPRRASCRAICWREPN